MLSLKAKKKYSQKRCHLNIPWSSKRQKKNNEKRERKKKNKKKSNNYKNNFLLSHFYIENILRKTLRICTDIDMNWSYRRRTSTQNIWQQTRYFNAGMDYYFFFYVWEKYRQFRKKQKHFLRIIFGSHPRQVTGSTCCGFFFKLLISQRFLHNLERNWKNSVCIDVENFAHL